MRGAGLLLMPASLAVEGDARVVVLIAARAVNACSWTVYEVLSDTYQQSVLPDRFRGSATAAGLWLGRCAELVGAVAAAGLVIMIGMTPVLIVAGVGATLAGLATLKIRTSPSRG